MPYELDPPLGHAAPRHLQDDLRERVERLEREVAALKRPLPPVLPWWAVPSSCRIVNYSTTPDDMEA